MSIALKKLNDKIINRVLDGLCPICGKEVDDNAKTIYIEGMNMEVCSHHPTPENLLSENINEL